MFCHQSREKASVLSGGVLTLAGAERCQRFLIKDFDAALAMQANKIASAEARNGAAHGFQRQTQEFTNIRAGCR
jgi:hypothetical protein